VTVDGSLALIGSPNFDTRSFGLNYEEALVACDRALVAQLDRSFDDDLTRARRVTLEEVRQWSPFARTRHRIARFLRSQM
jgi:cardiolipin synthase